MKGKQQNSMRKRNRRVEHRKEVKAKRAKERARQTVSQLIHNPANNIGAVPVGAPIYRPERKKLKGYEKMTYGRRKNFSKF